MSKSNEFPSTGDVLERLGTTLLPTTFGTFIVLLIVPVAVSVVALRWAEKRTGKDGNVIYSGSAAAGIAAFVVWSALAMYFYVDASGKSNAVGAGTLLLLLAAGIGYGVLFAVTAFVTLVWTAIGYTLLVGIWPLLIPSDNRDSLALESKLEARNEQLKQEQTAHQETRVRGNTQLESLRQQTNAQLRELERDRIRHVVVEIFEMMSAEETSTATFDYLAACKQHRSQREAIPVPDAVMRDILLFHRPLTENLPPGIAADRLRMVVEYTIEAGGLNSNGEWPFFHRDHQGPTSAGIPS